MKLKYASIVTIVSLTILLPTKATAQDEIDQAIGTIAARIAGSAQGDERRAIAVVDFANQDGVVSGLGQYIAESLITEFFLIDANRFEVVERRHLALLLKEQKLTMNLLFDPESLARVGGLLGVDEIATGTISDLGDQVEVNTRLISVSTGRITAASRLRIRKAGTVEHLLSIQPIVRSTMNGGSAPSSSVNVAVVARVLIDGFVVEVMNARREQNEIIVRYSITPTHEDAQVQVFGRNSPSSTVVTNEGNQHYAVEVAIGTARSAGYARAPLIKGVATTGELRFEGIGPDAQSLARVWVNFKYLSASDRSESLSAALSDIPID